MSESNLLRQYASTHMPELIGDAVLAADRLLQSLQIDKHLHEVESALSLSSDVETETTRDRIYEGVLYTLDRQISEYSIGFEEYELSVMHKTLESLHELPQHTNPHDLLELIDADGSAEERWCDLMGFFYDQDATDFLPYFRYVNPSLLEKLAQTLSDRIQTMPPEGDIEPEDLIEAEPKTSDTLTLLKSFIRQHAPDRFGQLLDEGYQIGYGIHHYLDRVLDETALTNQQMAKEYIASALASGEDVDTAIENAGDRLEEYIDDPATISKIILSMREYRGALS
mgnify:CR=1 FL=1